MLRQLASNLITRKRDFPGALIGDPPLWTGVSWALAVAMFLYPIGNRLVGLFRRLPEKAVGLALEHM